MGMRKQHLNFDFIVDYEKKKGKVVEVLTDPHKYKSRTESYEEWEGFMEALMITFSTSVHKDNNLTITENLKSEADGEQSMESQEDSKNEKDKKLCDVNDDAVPNQVFVDKISDDLKNEDFERLLRECGEFSDVSYKKKGTLFLFREALVTFKNANSVFTAYRLLNGYYILNSKVSVEVVNNKYSIKEVSKIQDHSFEKKAAKA